MQSGTLFPHNQPYLVPLDVSQAFMAFLTGLKDQKSSVHSGFSQSTIFDRNTLFIIREFMQPLIFDESTFKKKLCEYNVDNQNTHLATEDEKKIEHQKRILIKISMEGDMGCLNFFLNQWPFPSHVSLKQSGLISAIRGATENRYTYIIERLLQSIPDKQNVLDAVEEVLDVSLKKKDFEIFRWAILRYGRSLKQRQPLANKPTISQCILLQTSSDYPNPEKNPYFIFYAFGRILKQDTLEHKRNENSNRELSESSPNVALPVNQPIFPPAKNFSWSVYLKIIFGFAVIGGSALALIFLPTPLGIGAGIIGCLIGAGLFRAAYKENKNLVELDNRQEHGR